MQAIKCHVTFSKLNRKGIVEGETGEDLVRNIKRAFGIEQDIALQMWNKDWDDWINIKYDEVTNMSKLNVLLDDTSKPSYPAPASPTTSASGRQACQSGKSTSCEPDAPKTSASTKCSLSDRGISKTPASKKNEYTATAGTCASGTSAQISAVANKQRVTLKPWPVPFLIPESKMKSSVKKAIADDNGLKPQESASLVDTLFDEMTKHTYCPTKSQYTEVISNLLASYPNLANNLEGTDAMKYWKSKLSQKFRNEKKRHHKDNELAQPKKKMKPPGSSTNTKQNAHSNMWGVTHYLPDRPEGEDDVSIAKHKEAMRVESKKLRQDLSKVRLLMDLTFADRRKSIVNDLCKIEDLRSEYPCLFHEDEMMAEFRRLTEKDGRKLFQEGLDKYVPGILEVSTRSSTRPTVLSAVAKTNSAESRKRTREVGAVVLLAALLNEKKEVLVRPSEEPENDQDNNDGLHIEYHGKNITEILNGEVKKYDVIAEKELVCTTDDFLQAVCVLMVAHYVFNMTYHPKLNNTLTFLQKVIMNIKDGNPNPKRLINLLFQVNSKLKVQARKSEN